VSERESDREDYSVSATGCTNGEPAAVFSFALDISPECLGAVHQHSESTVVRLRHEICHRDGTSISLLTFIARMILIHSKPQRGHQ
jgi:hypothetical protein